MLTTDIACELLRYDPETGHLYWRRRNRKWFDSEHRWKVWNTKHSGNRVGSDTGAGGYILTSVFNKTYSVHRIIWLMQTGEWPNEIDHINGIRSDNRWCNLRNADRREQTKNTCRRCDNTSGVTGVTRHKQMGKWYARINVKGKQIDLGYYENFNDAVMARKRAEQKYGFHPNHGREL